MVDERQVLMTREGSMQMRKEIFGHSKGRRESYTEIKQSKNVKKS